MVHHQTLFLWELRQQHWNPKYCSGREQAYDHPLFLLNGILKVASFPQNAVYIGFGMLGVYTTHQLNVKVSIGIISSKISKCDIVILVVIGHLHHCVVTIQV